MKAFATLITILLILPLSGCSGMRDYSTGQQLIQEGQTIAGLRHLQRATEQDPDNIEYRYTYVRQQEKAIQQFLSEAEREHNAHHSDAAKKLLNQTLELDPSNIHAKEMLAGMVAEDHHTAWLQEAQADIKTKKWLQASKKIHMILAESPRDTEAINLKKIVDAHIRPVAPPPVIVHSKLNRPVTLEFHDADVRMIFQSLYQAAGINFIFDHDIKPNTTATLFLKNTSIADAIHYVLTLTGLAQKILNDNTVLIYPDTPEKKRIYNDLMMHTFYLSNANAKDVMQLLQSMLKVKDISIDERLNLVFLRADPDVIGMAERLVKNVDQPEPEVMLDVSVLEVSRNTLLNLGIKYPDQLSLSFQGASAQPGTGTLNEFQHAGSNLIHVTVSDPLLVANLKSQAGESNLLANPRIRVKDRHKAKIHIGDKVPVITNTSGSTGFISENVNYLDVGLQLEVEPRIYLDNEVSMKINLDVSSIVNQITTTSGLLVYQIGNREAATTLRLKDGETQVLAGLINNEETKNADKIPGIGSLPLIGRLFSSHQNSANKTEIILLITPHILRNLAPPEATDIEFPAGTESAMGASPIQLTPMSSAPAVPPIPALSNAPPPIFPNQPVQQDSPINGPAGINLNPYQMRLPPLPPLPPKAQ